MHLIATSRRVVIVTMMSGRERQAFGTSSGMVAMSCLNREDVYGAPGSAKGVEKKDRKRGKLQGRRDSIL